MSVVGVVPMKGHSERVPGKNLRPIAGRPLFHWVVEALLEAEGVDQVLVDTDSDAIESAVRDSYPQLIINRRPQRLCGDSVPMHDVVAHIAEGVEHDLLLQTHATNPLLKADTIDRAIRAFVSSSDCDSLMSVTAWHSRFYFPDGTPVNHDPEELKRTQDLPPLYEENSNIYICPTGQIRRTGLRLGSKPLLFEIDAEEAIDIDSELDFEIAGFLLMNRHG